MTVNQRFGTAVGPINRVLEPTSLPEMLVDNQKAKQYKYPDKPTQNGRMLW